MENSRIVPASGEFYRHFKGNLYQIVGVARHSETMEQMVVYQALYGDYGLFVRPLDLFLSPVDKKKYPEASQKYRFEKCVPEEKDKNNTEVPAVRTSLTEEQKEAFTEADADDTVRPEILRFLDAEGAVEKLEVLRQLRMNMDENLLTTIELSMDLLPNDKESMERRYELVEQNLEKRIRFEGGRLR